jgi:hypothetical protein
MQARAVKNFYGWFPDEQWGEKPARTGRLCDALLPMLTGTA